MVGGRATAALGGGGGGGTGIRDRDGPAALFVALPALFAGPLALFAAIRKPEVNIVSSVDSKVNGEDGQFCAKLTVDIL
jgi:hypothetical protein